MRAFSMKNEIVHSLSLQPCGEYANLGKVYEAYIDNTPLLSLFTDFEARFTNKINGSYTSILNENSLLKLLNNDSDEFIPLGCDCGEWQCWFVIGEINIYQDFVYWWKWKHPFRDDKSKKNKGLYWSYKEFPVLVFDKQQYEKEIQRVLKQCS